MQLRPKRVIIYIILHRLIQFLLDENDRSSEGNRCASLLFRAVPCADKDSWNEAEKVVIDAIDALNGAFASIASGVPSNIESLNDDLSDALDNAGY